MSPLKKKAKETRQFPILCRVWEEDGVWNGAAEDLAVAAYGRNFEEAKTHLRDAIICHLQAMEEAGKLEQAVEYLQQRARDLYVSIDEFPANKALVRIDAVVRDDRVSAAV
jgi:hypothetical protein